MLKFSSDSSIASFVIAIVMVGVAFPVVTIAVVDAPVKSWPAIAVPLTVLMANDYCG